MRRIHGAAATLLAAALAATAPAAAWQLPAAAGERSGAPEAVAAFGTATAAARLGGRRAAEVLPVLPPAPGQEPAAGRRSPFRPLAVAKWTVLAGAAGAAAWGVVEARDADDAYAELEALCAADEEACAERLASGAYADPGLEAVYQEVVALDRRAGRALLAGELGFAAAVVLFVLDLRNAGPPENIPFEPRMEAGAGADGGVRLTLRLPLPAR